MSRLGHGIGVAILPSAIILTLIAFILGPPPLLLAVIIGASASLIFEEWAGIAGAFRESFLGGLLVFGSQASGGAIVGFVVGLILVNFF